LRGLFVYDDSVGIDPEQRVRQNACVLGNCYAVGPQVPKLRQSDFFLFPQLGFFIYADQSETNSRISPG